MSRKIMFVLVVVSMLAVMCAACGDDGSNSSSSSSTPNCGGADMRWNGSYCEQVRYVQAPAQPVVVPTNTPFENTKCVIYDLDLSCIK